MYGLYVKKWYKSIFFSATFHQVCIVPVAQWDIQSNVHLQAGVRVPKRSMVFLLKGQCAFGAQFSAEGASTKRNHIFLLSHLPEIHTYTYVQILRNTCTYIYIHVDPV
jgi:hypothetical protein